MNQDQQLREALERAERKLAAYVGVCEGDKELTDAILPMVRKALFASEQEPHAQRQADTELQSQAGKWVDDFKSIAMSIYHADDGGKSAWEVGNVRELAMMQKVWKFCRAALTATQQEAPSQSGEREATTTREQTVPVKREWMARLSKALGNPKITAALVGDSVEDALVELAIARLEPQAAARADDHPLMHSTPAKPQAPDMEASE